MDLRIACKAGTNDLPYFVFRILLAEFARKFRPFRPWSDKTHLATQNIPQLRQFIETQPAEIVAGASASRVAGNRPDRTEIPFRSFLHRAKFDNRE